MVFKRMLSKVGAFASSVSASRMGESPYPEGMCYLAIVRPEFRDQFSLQFSSFPKVLDLVGMSRDFFVSDYKLKRTAVKVVDKVGLHMVFVGDGQFDIPVVAAYGVLCGVASVGGWPAGSLGEALEGVMLSSWRLVSREDLLVTWVGGTLTLPVVGSSEAVLLGYYATVQACLERGVAVETVWLDGFVQPSVGMGTLEEKGVPSDGVARGLPRGPNYLRNQAARMRARVQKEERRQCKLGVPGRRDCPMAAELRELRVERQLIEEKRRLDKLKSPVQVMEDAMRMVDFAGRCAKSANDSKVAGWARTVATSYSESVARSAGSSVVSFDSVVSAVSGVSESELRDPVGVSVVIKKSVGVPSTSVVRGAAVSSGRGVLNSDGIAYNFHTARKWVSSYACVKRNVRQGRSVEETAKLSNVSVSEVKKYFRLCEEFGLSAS